MEGNKKYNYVTWGARSRESRITVSRCAVKTHSVIPIIECDFSMRYYLPLVLSNYKCNLCLKLAFKRSHKGDRH